MENIGVITKLVLAKAVSVIGLGIYAQGDIAIALLTWGSVTAALMLTVAMIGDERI